MQEWYINKSNSVHHHINKRKDKNNMINSIHTEKEFDNIQHHFMINTVIKVDIEGPYLNVM